MLSLSYGHIKNVAFCKKTVQRNTDDMPCSLVKSFYVKWHDFIELNGVSTLRSSMSAALCCPLLKLWLSQSTMVLWKVNCVGLCYMFLSEAQKGQGDKEKWFSHEVQHGRANRVQGTRFITYFFAHCYFSFSTSCASVFMNCSRLNLMFITNLVAVTMSSILYIS